MSKKEEEDRLKPGFLPVFKKDEHEFIIPYDEFVGDTERDAEKIGIGSLMEAVVYGFSFTFKVINVDSGLQVYPAELGPLAVRVLPKDWEKQLSKSEEN